MQPKGDARGPHQFWWVRHQSRKEQPGGETALFGQSAPGRGVGTCAISEKSKGNLGATGIPSTKKRPSGAARYDRAYSKRARTW